MGQVPDRQRTLTFAALLAVCSVASAWAASAAPGADQPAAPTIDRRLTAVSALAGDDVWAVGYVQRNDVQRTLVKHWDGTSWTRVPSVDPDSTVNRLLGVTALASDDVWAVGTANISGKGQPLIEHWDGASWSQVPSPRYSGLGSELTSVTALSPTNIWAVGGTHLLYGDAQVIIQHWNGKSWTQVENDNPTWLHRDLTGVTATSAKDVWAVGMGYQDDEAGFLPISLHWDGTTWTQIPISVKDKFDNNPLLGVDAVSPNNVWAVGHHDLGSGDPPETLVEHFDGNGWLRKQAPTGNDTVLNAVSATASDDVWAVGSTNGDANAFVLHRDSAGWSQVDAPSRGAITALYGVSALSADDAWAVGTSSGTHVRTIELVEYWDGQSWTIVH